MKALEVSAAIPPFSKKLGDSGRNTHTCFNVLSLLKN
jgi:hypothetical protein